MGSGVILDVSITSPATSFHSHRVYFQIMVWMGMANEMTQLSGDGKRKVRSWFQLWQTRMLRLTKSSIATVRGGGGDANPLDATANAIDSPALLLVDLAKLKTVTIQTTLKRLILKKRRRMTLKTERAWNLFRVLAWWLWTVQWQESNFIMIHQLSNIETGLNVFLAPKNLGIDTKIIKFEWFVSEFWQLKRISGHFGRHLEKKTFPGVRLS